MDSVVTSDDPMIDAAALRDHLDAEVVVADGEQTLLDAAAGSADALVEALRGETIAAASLDVLRTEPPEADHPLFGLDNCVVTPHAAWYSVEAREDLNATVAENVRAALAGETPPNYIDPETEWL